MCLNKYVQYNAFCKYDHDDTVSAGSSSNMFDKAQQQKFRFSVIMEMKAF